MAQLKADVAAERVPARLRNGRRGHGRSAQDHRLADQDAKRAMLAELENPAVDPDENLPEVLALAELRAKLAGGVEDVTPAALAKAQQLADHARLAAEGERARTLRALEAERQAKVVELINQLTGDGVAGQVNEVLRLRDEAEQAIRALHEAATALHKSDERAVWGLWALIGPERDRLPSMAIQEVSRLVNELVPGAGTSGFDVTIEHSFPSEAIGHAIWSAIREPREIGRVAEYVKWAARSDSSADRLLSILRRRAGVASPGPAMTEEEMTDD